MSDKERLDDEYHFVDDPDMGSHDEVSSPEPSLKEEPPSQSGNMLQQWLTPLEPFYKLIQNNFMLRTGLIALSIILMAIIIYSCSSNPLAKKTISLSAAPTMQKRSNQIAAMPTIQSSTAQEALEMTRRSSAADTAKLTSMEQMQTDLQTQVNALSNQFSGNTANVTALMNNLKTLSEQVSQLSLMVQNQAKITADMHAHLKKETEKKVQSNKNMVVAAPPAQYFLQAIIPGRAWLISTNGDTVTVREGTRISSYGVVRFIDAKRCRVLTSSGQVIRFSQEDS